MTGNFEKLVPQETNIRIRHYDINKLASETRL